MGSADFEYSKPHIEGPLTIFSSKFVVNKSQVERTRHAVHLFHTGKLTSIGHKSRNVPKPPDIPPREASLKIVEQAQVSSKKKNRAAMLHALASIEQWA